jgi:hypothetical protein
MLQEDEIWPDGDGPEDPTPEDVVAYLREQFPSQFDLLWAMTHDWNIMPESLEVNGREV